MIPNPYRPVDETGPDAPNDGRLETKPILRKSVISLLSSCVVFGASSIIYPTTAAAEALVIILNLVGACLYFLAVMWQAGVGEE